MAYFIFNLENISQPIYKIAENKFNLDGLNIDKSVYHVVEGSQDDFNKVRLNEKIVLNVSGQNILFQDIKCGFTSKEKIIEYVDSLSYHIGNFLKNNKNNILYSKWNNYNLQLNNFKTNIKNAHETLIEDELKIKQESVLVLGNTEEENVWVGQDKEVWEKVEKIQEPFLTLRNATLEQYFKNNNLPYYSLLELP